MQKLIINPKNRQDYQRYRLVTDSSDVIYSNDYWVGLAALDEHSKPLCNDMGGQLFSSFQNLVSELSESGYTLDDVEQLDIYITSIDDFFLAYRKLIDQLPEHRSVPAGTLTEVATLPISELKIKIEATLAKL